MIITLWEKREVKERLSSALESELENFENNFNEMMKKMKDFLPKILEMSDKLKGSPEDRRIELFLDVEFHKANSGVLESLVELLESFIKLSKACNQISRNESFMQKLKKLEHEYDLVNIMANIYKNGIIEINNNFIGFLRIYKDDAIKGLSKLDKELDLTEDKDEQLNLLFIEAEKFIEAYEKQHERIKKQMWKIGESEKLMQILELYSRIIKKYEKLQIKVAPDLDKNLIEEVRPILASTNLGKLLKTLDEILKILKREFKL